MGRRKRRVKAVKEAAAREKQIWISTRRGSVVCDTLKAAALHASREAGVPVSEYQVLAAARLGFPLCGIKYSYTKPEPGPEKRPPLLRRGKLEEGVRRIY
jgi:hypothetical protein